MTTNAWLPVTQAHTLQFFFEHLRDVTDANGAPEPELLYNASVLAHFATISTASPDFPSTPHSLGRVFDLFVLDRSRQADPEIMEGAAAQCLLLTGFFGSQLKSRYNLKWYAALGASFYERAGRTSSNRARAAMMATMAVRFAFWRKRQAMLAVELREQARLIH